MGYGESSLKKVVEEFDRMKSERLVWDNHYQILGEYISQNKQNFQSDPQAGEFLADELFDSTGTFAAHSAASSLLGMLWAGSAKQSIEITPPDDMEMTTELEEFYKTKMTGRTIRAFDDPKSNLIVALDEYMLDQMIFGTSGVGVERGIESKLLFSSYGVKQMYIVEGKAGKVVEVWLCYDWTIDRIVAEYGAENVSEDIKKLYESGKGSEKRKILNVIRKRKEFKAKLGKLSMPFESLHIEHKTKNLLSEEGFEELPVAVARFRKLTYEMYGRSCGMMALSDIREANALREGVITATEKNLDPPQGVYNDGILGGGVIDTSAGALNVFADTNNGQPPMFPLITVGSISDAVSRIEELKNNIAQHFNIDRLLDFNNEQEMTFGEAQIRNQIRTASLSSLFARQISEMFTPLVERSVNMLFRMGEFGVVEGTDEEQELLKQGIEPEYVPDEIAKRLEAGEDVYQVKYKTQAAQASKAESFQAITELVTFSAELMQVDPSIRNRVDFHEAIKEMANIRALPPSIIRQDDAVQALNEQQAQEQQMQQGIAMAEQASGAVKNFAEAENAGNNT